MKSIKSRLTLVSTVVLVLFMVLTAVALERAVVKRALEAEEDGLQLLIYSLLAAVDRNEEGYALTVSGDRLFETDLFTRHSGLYALLYDGEGQEIWRSRSLGLDLSVTEAIDLGDWEFDTPGYLETPYFRLGFALQWPDVDNKLRRYQVVVWRDASDYFEQRDRFRQTLWAWLIITTLLLLLVTYVVTHWSLRPLHRVGLEIKAIEDHRQTSFERDYPSEIAPLTENLNILLKREAHQRQRYRHALDDLAHSLKTPLAVLTGLADQAQLDTDRIATLREQTERMNQIVSYQLQKANSAAPVSIARPLDLVGVIGKLQSALDKVYREKSVRVERSLPEQMMLRIDEGDCLEVMGNLLDNAFKYARGQVRISGRADEDGRALTLLVEDDGNGLADEEIEQILRRGTRLDEATEGQGIGLAVVADTVASYDMELGFGRASLGGLAVTLNFSPDPQAGAGPGPVTG